MEKDRDSGLADVPLQVIKAVLVKHANNDVKGIKDKHVLCRAADAAAGLGPGRSLQRV